MAYIIIGVLIVATNVIMYKVGNTRGKMNILEQVHDCLGDNVANCHPLQLEGKLINILEMMRDECDKITKRKAD